MTTTCFISTDLLTYLMQTQDKVQLVEEPA